LVISTAGIAMSTPSAIEAFSTQHRIHEVERVDPRRDGRCARPMRAARPVSGRRGTRHSQKRAAQHGEWPAAADNGPYVGDTDPDMVSACPMCAARVVPWAAGGPVAVVIHGLPGVGRQPGGSSRGRAACCACVLKLFDERRPDDAGGGADRVRPVARRQNPHEPLRLAASRPHRRARGGAGKSSSD